MVAGVFGNGERRAYSCVFHESALVRTHSTVHCNERLIACTLNKVDQDLGGIPVWDAAVVNESNHITNMTNALEVAGKEGVGPNNIENYFCIL